jgi:hypothetical protein
MKRTKNMIIKMFLILAIFINGMGSPEKKENTCILHPKLVFSIDHEKGATLLFEPRDIAVSKNGNIYVLDSKDCKIKCFSPQGKFLFSFGREGEGPGEFSPDASTLKILKDGNIYLIDNGLRRITIFSLDGKYIKSFITKERYGDIYLFKDTYFLTNFELERNWKPIHITKDFQKIEKSFGEIIDPGNLFKRDDFFEIQTSIAFEKNTSVIVNSKGEIFYSQWNPYKIIKYSSEGKIKEFYRDVGFDTGLKLSIKKMKGIKGVAEEPSSFVPEIYLAKKDRILVPIFSPDLKENFIDIYDSNGSLLYACRLPIELYGKETVIVATEFDGERSFYIIYFSPEKPPILSKYDIEFPGE